MIFVTTTVLNHLPFSASVDQLTRNCLGSAFCSEMAGGFYSFAPLGFSEIQSAYSPHGQDFKKLGVSMEGYDDPLLSVEELSQVYPLCPDYGDYQDNITPNKGLQFFDNGPEQEALQNQLPAISNCLTWDEYFGSCSLTPPQVIQEVMRSENIAKSNNEFSYPFARSSSLELLNNYGGGLKKLSTNQCSSKASNDTRISGQKKLSAEEIIRVAGARYIQLFDQRYDDHSMLMRPFGCALSDLSEEEVKDVELAHLLLAAAEKVGYQQFDRASRLLSCCEWIAFEHANTVQKVVYCFAEALRERIDKATGSFTPKERKGNHDALHGINADLAVLNAYLKFPVSQVTQLTSIQAIMENFGSARKLHVIDLDIRSGVQWTAMMQALAERRRHPLEHLTVTAFGLADNHRKIQETGRSLESFARSMNVPFTFRAVCLPSINDIKQELFKISSDEYLVIFSNMFLRTLISSPESLDKLMRVINNLKPSIMVVAEVEANHNSPNFVNRFIEALFFYSAYFDCLETCLDQNLECKSVIEATFCRGIREILAADDNERIVRSVKIEVWRAFFSRFKMVEIGFSELSFYQAGLVPKQFAYGNGCSIDKDGKCLIIGWKGTPLHSLSAWKFCRVRPRKFLASNRS